MSTISTAFADDSSRVAPGGLTLMLIGLAPRLHGRESAGCSVNLRNEFVPLDGAVVVTRGVNLSGTTHVAATAFGKWSEIWGDDDGKIAGIFKYCSSRPNALRRIRECGRGMHVSGDVLTCGLYSTAGATVLDSTASSTGTLADELNKMDFGSNVTLRTERRRVTDATPVANADVRSGVGETFGF